MRAIPFFNLIILPGVSFSFQKEYFQEIAGDIEVHKGEELAFIMLREDKNRGDLSVEDCYPIGVYGVVENIGRDGEITVNAVKRLDLSEIETNETGIVHFHGDTRPLVEDMDPEERENRFEEVKTAFLKYMINTQWGMMANMYMQQWKSVEDMISALSPRLPIANEEKYAIIACDHISERFDLIEKALYELLELVKVGNEAQNAQTASNEKLYREDAIRKQMDFLQKELDAMHPENISDARMFEKRLEELELNEEAQKEASKVLNRLKQEGKTSPEYGLSYDYLEFVTSLPWPKKDKDAEALTAGKEKKKQEKTIAVDLPKAKEILDEDHYGMKKVKERILQQLAVMSLKGEISGSILLFVGPPGTGKTSIGKGIARALERKYTRVALGGVRDESEIRGHRRTYIGAMPGRILNAIQKCGSREAVVVLDEVDKLASSHAGDPSSALLEVLDPEQNATFTDHYLNAPFDLSRVLFVCTANTTDTIPAPLLNRMEVIEFPGYTATEKKQIAKRHLLPKALASSGIKSGRLKVSDSAIEKIIADYTAESGVRGLKKRLDTLCRVAAVKLVMEDKKSVSVSAKRLKDFLDARPIRHDEILKKPRPGVVTGLAWTAAGGEILFIETMLTPGSGRLMITGRLGDVMKESVQIALTLAKNAYPEQAKLLKENDLHIHVPEGAVPKDGPSAGITMTTAICSLLSGISVDPELAMTGEISLRGAVLPIGGLPEKLMAAVRAGVTRVLIPQANVRDLEDVPEEVRAQLEIKPVKTLDEVLKEALP